MLTAVATIHSKTVNEVIVAVGNSGEFLMYEQTRQGTNWAVLAHRQ